MPTFIDESGDTGHSPGSLPFFRLASVWMPSRQVADAFREGVRQLRRELKLTDDFEFKFSLTHFFQDRRLAFLNLALKYDFRFAFSAIDKHKGDWRKAPAAEQHWATATDLAASLRGVYLEQERSDRPLKDQVLVDDNGDHGFLEAIEVAFCGLGSRCHPGVPMVKKPKFRGSRPEEGIHLADMVCGACGAFLDGNPDWYNLIKSRCVGRPQTFS